MDRDDIEDLRVEMRVEEASKDSPANRTREFLRAQIDVLQETLMELDDLDDLPSSACELTEKLRARVQALSRAAVQFDRARGATWGNIGAALEISRQAAWERFGP